jgi:hypothetical protein
MKAAGFPWEPDASLDTVEVVDKGGSGVGAMTFFMYIEYFFTYIGGWGSQPAGPSVGDAIDGWVSSKVRASGVWDCG